MIYIIFILYFLTKSNGINLCFVYSNVPGYLKEKKDLSISKWKNALGIYKWKKDLDLDFNIVRVDPMTVIDAVTSAASSPDVVAGVSETTNTLKGLITSASGSGSVPLQAVTEAANIKGLINSAPLIREGSPDSIYSVQILRGSTESLLSNVSSVYHPTGYITILESTNDLTLAMLNKISPDEARMVLQYVTESCPSGVDLKDFVEKSNFGSTVGDAKIPLDTFGEDSPEYIIMDNILMGSVVIVDSIQANLEAFQELLKFFQENLALAEEYDGKDSIAVNTFKDQIAHCESCIQHIQDGNPLSGLSSIKHVFTQHGKIPDLMDYQYIRSAWLIKKAFQEKFGITGAKFAKDYLKDTDKIDTVKLKYIYDKIYSIIKFTNDSDRDLRGLHAIVRRTLHKIMYRMFRGPKWR